MRRVGPVPDGPPGMVRMGAGRSFVVQAFEHVEGRLVPTTRRHATSEQDALRQAEALAARFPGAAAVQVVAEGASEAVTVLGAFGDVPDEVSDGLAGG